MTSVLDRPPKIWSFPMNTGVKMGSRYILNLYSFKLVWALRSGEQWLFGTKNKKWVLDV